MLKRCKYCGTILENIIIKNKKYDYFLTEAKLFNNKNYFRICCQECFEKKFKREPKSPIIVNYDMEFLLNIPKSELRIECQKRSFTKEKCIKKYGEIEGIRKWEEYVEKQSITNTFEYKNKKYGMNKKDFDDYNKSRAVTKENLIKKYGEIEGIRKWEEYVEKQKVAGVTKEYFIEKYGEIEGIKKYSKVNKKKKLILENFIRKYGEIEGIKKYKKYKEKQKAFFSKSSQNFFWELYSLLDNELKNKTYFAELNKEFFVYNKIKSYSYDFVISNIGFVLEYNGDLFHANPSFFKPTDNPNPFRKNLTAAEIWEYDKIKRDFIETKYGYTIFYIWESDVIKNKKESLNKVLEKINEFRNNR